MLQRAETFSQQVDVIEACLAMGVGLREIEDYLDYLESLRSRWKGKQTSDGSNGTSPDSPCHLDTGQSRCRKGE
jgi:hypothetical protein